MWKGAFLRHERREVPFPSTSTGFNVKMGTDYLLDFQRDIKPTLDTLDREPDKGICMVCLSLVSVFIYYIKLVSVDKDVYNGHCRDRIGNIYIYIEIGRYNIEKSTI